MLHALLSHDTNFPIQSQTTLRRQMRLIGFKYKQTAKAKIFLDSASFQAQCAYYFRKLDELRSENVILYYHDETWLNKNEEKTIIWFDSQQHGRLRTAEGKGKYILVDKLCYCIIKNVQVFSLGQRLAISGLISLKGFHLRSLDIFKCDEVHNMDSDHFSQWIKNTSEILRSEHGKNAKLVIIIDNATWHNQLTTESQPPKRSWKKSILQEWLTTRKIKYDTFMTKAELLELAFENLPPRQYVVDKVAAEYGVQILRIPIKHCVLNPIELSWAGLKKYVRSMNVNFNLGDVADLCNKWLSELQPEQAAKYFAHVKKCEEEFKKADQLAEQLEDELLESDIDESANSNDDDTKDDDL